MSKLTALAQTLRPRTAPTLLGAAWPVVLAVGLGIVMQFVVRPGINDPYWSKLMLDIGINVVLAVSLTMVNGFTGQFSMGHAGFLAVGGYVAGAITYYFSLRTWGSAAMTGGAISGMVVREGAALATPSDAMFLGALIAGGFVAALLGLAVGLPSLRLRGDYLAIVTLGFGEIVRVLITKTEPVIKSAEEAAATPWWQLPMHVGRSLGFTGLPKYTSLFWVYGAVAVTIVFATRLKLSTFGRAFLAIREDEIAAEAMGVHTTRYKVWAFVLAAFFAGIAGGLSAHTLGVGISGESAGFLKSFDIIIMVVLGGLGSISGATLAAAVVTLLPEWLRPVAEYRMVIYALALILMMIFRPQGLFGVREVWERGAWTWLPWMRKGARA